jgi:Holliday junction DNA helicase RuvA
MIGRLRGQVAAVGEGQAIIDVAGVGYLVHAGSRTLARLVVGDVGEIHVETKMSETDLRLFGFLSGEERAWFARLQDAPGVGAKVALAILDALPPAQLMDAIALGDVAAVTRAHGVGRKLAERIVTEFKGKPPPGGLFSSMGGGALGPATLHATALTGVRVAAQSALVNLGYAPADASKAVATAARDAGEEATEAQLIKAALKALAPA